MNTNAKLDDIMSSIRTGVEAESGKTPSGSADLVDQAAAEAAAAEAADDDVLELTPAEQVAPPAAAPEANPTDVLGVPALAPSDEASDEFDKLLAEISQEKQTRAAAVQAHKEALLADIEPLGAEPLAPPAAEATAPAAGPVADAAAGMPQPMATTPMPAAPAGAHTVNAVTGEGGDMQLVLPAEVLAIALRPMVQQWLDANLAGVVERLVQAEIAKLNNG